MKQQTFSLIECLESKIAPAGTVTAAIVGGVLTLTGGPEDNDLTITETQPDHFIITGAGGTLIQLGTAPAAGVVEFDAALLGLKSDLKEGNDNLVLSGVDLTKDLTINQGGGTNTLRLSNLQLGGNLVIQGGVGTDTVTMDSIVMISGNATFNLGNGNNTVDHSSLVTFVVQGAFNYTGGNAADSIALFSSDFLSLGSLTVAAGTGSGGVSLNSGGDLIIEKTVNVTSLDHPGVGFSTAMTVTDRLIVGGSFTVKNGLGDNVVYLAVSDSIFIGGALSITNGNSSTLSSMLLSSNIISIEGAVTLKNGNGRFINEFSATNLEVAGALSIVNGNGIGTSTNQISAIQLDVHGGVSMTNGDGTFENIFSVGQANVGGVLSFVNKSSNAALTTNSVSIISTLNVGGITIANGNGRFSNLISAPNGRIAGNLSITNGDSTNTVTNTLSIPLVTGNVLIKNGSGEFDTTFNSLASSHLRVGGNLSILNGNATTTIDNVIALNQLDVDGALTITNQAGTFTNNIATTNLNVKGAVAITNGSTSVTLSNDIASINELRIGGGLKIINGDGLVSTNITAGALFISGNLLIQNGSHSTGELIMNLNATSVAITGTATLKSISGDTRAWIQGEHVLIGGAVSITTGEGADSVRAIGTQNFAAGSVTFNMGEGNTATQVGSLSSTAIKGAVSLSALHGNDDWLVLGIGRIGGGFTANYGTGLGTSSLQLGSSSVGSLDIAGPVNVNVGSTVGGFASSISRVVTQGTFTLLGSTGLDTVSMARNSFRGASTINLQNGNDVLTINDSSFLGTLGIQTGIGTDTVNIENDVAFTSRSIFHKAVSISTGDDVDTIIIAGAAIQRIAEFKAGLTLNGGAGADIFTPGPATTRLIGTVTQVDI